MQQTLHYTEEQQAHRDVVGLNILAWVLVAIGVIILGYYVLSDLATLRAVSNYPPIDTSSQFSPTVNSQDDSGIYNSPGGINQAIFSL